MNTARKLASLAVVLVALIACAEARSENSVWSVGWGNDEFLGSDNLFTNGIFVQKHGELTDSSDAAGGALAIGKNLARRVLPVRDDLFYRASWAVGHNMQTPDDVNIADPILTDVPYGAMLGWTNTHIALNDQQLYGVQVLFGWIGSLAQGRRLQTAAHRLTNATKPLGWGNQLGNEPLVNVYAMRKGKWWQNDWADLSWDADAALGNFFTYGQAALELRIGDRPRGFAPAPTPIGRNMDFDGRIATPGESYFYLSVIVRGTGLLYGLPRHGNLLRSNNFWTENEQIDPEHWLGQVTFGLHYERPRWAVHFSLNLASDSVDASGAVPVNDPSNNYGILTFEWRS